MIFLAAICHDIRSNTLEATWLEDTESGFNRVRSHNYSAAQIEDFIADTGNEGLPYAQLAWPQGASTLPPYVEPAPSTISKLEYMGRFTDAELAGIYTAAKSVVQIEIWLEKFKLATDINLADPRTIDGVQSLEAAGLIGVGRAAEILTP